MLSEAMDNSSSTTQKENREILQHLFGDSDDEEECCQEDHSGRIWEEREEVKGLWICRRFLNPQQQKSLVQSIENERWFDESSYNQAMRFGDLPEWALKLSELIHYAICCYDVKCNICKHSRGCSHDSLKGSPLSLDLLWREPLFNQMIVNSYQPGEGICPHVDLLKFEDGIAIISLESECVMHFTYQDAINDDVQFHKGQSHNVQNCGKGGNTSKDSGSKVPILLQPGDLVIMYGEARYHWLHEINRKPGFQIWKGKEISQRRRISVTLRRLSET